MNDIYYNRLHNSIKELQEIIKLIENEHETPEYLITQLLTQVGYIKHTANRLTCQ